MIRHLAIKKLQEKGLTIAIAESCTGGLIGAAITSVSGASTCFGYGLVTYSNEAKHKLLGVPWEILMEFGAVSHQTAKQMSKGIRKLANSDIGLSVTGIAGPSGGTKSKPVGLVYIALDKRDFCVSHKFFFHGDREKIRKHSTEQAIKMIIQYGVN
ncbi:MAG: CinA family protein [Bacillota bacterium]|jgi:PncC family amidohydrolase